MIKPIIAALIAVGVIGGGSYGAIEVSTQTGSHNRATPSNYESQGDTRNKPAEIPDRAIVPGDDIAPLPTLAPIVPHNRPTRTFPLPDQGGSTTCYDSPYSNYTDCSGPGGSTTCYDSPYSNYTDCSGPGGSTTCYDSPYSNYVDCSGSGGNATCYDSPYSNYTDCSGPGGSTTCYDSPYSNYTDCNGPGGSSTTCYDSPYSNYIDCSTR